MQTEQRKTTSPLSIVLYVFAVMAILVGVYLLIAFINFGSTLNSILGPLLGGVNPIVMGLLAPVTQGASAFGVILFVIMLMTALLLYVAGRLIGRSLSLEERVRRLEEQLKNQ